MHHGLRGMDAPGKMQEEIPVVAIAVSIVQGSGVGLSEYDISASDLHPLNASNIFVKFAGDTSLISGAATCHTITDEIQGVHRWATKNNLRLNSSKSREMLIVRGGRWQVPHPPPLGNGILRVDHMKILGATIRSDMKMTTHVSEILAACTCSLYPLRILRAHGLSGDPLFQVTRATAINQILYAGPAWWGLSARTERGLTDSAASWRERI